MFRKLLNLILLSLSVMLALGSQLKAVIPAHDSTSPEAVVTAFCTEYVEHVGYDEQNQAFSKLLDNDFYKKSAYLSAEVAQDLAETLATLHAEHFDPLAHMTDGELQNPLTSGFYDDMPSLTEYFNINLNPLWAYIKEKYHTFVKAPEPLAFAVGSGHISGNTATVKVKATWNGGEAAQDVAISLEKADAGWLITDIRPVY